MAIDQTKKDFYAAVKCLVEDYSLQERLEHARHHLTKSLVHEIDEDLKKVTTEISLKIKDAPKAKDKGVSLALKIIETYYKMI